MCAAPSCHLLITAVVSKNPPNCDLLIPTSNAKMNVYSLASSFENDCTRLMSTPR
uniref:Elicitin n=1 Tax=Globisporangium ultimum (strain ATCC 200006 / CBS 805.95 / DAOM BR144) TaxID=431595 RepID=K3XA46_GLOUD